MNWTVPLALYSWPLVVIVFFAVMKPRRAVIAAFLIAWLFLPMAGFQFEGIPSYTKLTATSYGVLLGVMLFDAKRLTGFRLAWIDVPIFVYCVSPMASSIVNGLGAYDGASMIFTQIVTWGVPYLMGRLYLADLDGLRDLAIGIFIGGLIYMPLVLFEVRMSPRLHIWVYGYHQHSWRQALRFDGWRPTVFMQHGLMVAMWMVSTTVIGYWLWWTKALLSIRHVPMSLLVPAMAVTAVLCKSAGALVLGVIGVATLLVTRTTKMKVALACLVLSPVLYMGTRAPGIWDGDHLVSAVEVLPLLADRMQSFQYRLDAEDTLAEHALRQPVFGWGTHGRNRPSQMGFDEDVVATDGLWVITLGQRGVVGLLAWTAVLLVPVGLLLWRMPVAAWWEPAFAPVAALAMVLVLWMIDCLFNAMFNPIYVLAAGGISGFVMTIPGLMKSQAVWRQRPVISRNPQPRSAVDTDLAKDAAPFDHLLIRRRE